MKNFDLLLPEIEYHLPMIFVQGTGEGAYLFGVENEQRRIHINDFYISQFLVTQQLWDLIMHNDRDQNQLPATNVSYNSITIQNGFLEKLLKKINKQFRLPTETEWEYAARGGIHWGDYFLFSGGDNLNELGWYKQNSNREIKPVGLKKPNQLGIYDMCGNVWKWCQDWFIRDTDLVPKDGSAYMNETKDKVLRGGCNHNGAIHCTVTKRYEIAPGSIDGAIGFRIALSV